MKKVLCLILALLLVLSFSACSEKEPEPEKAPEPSIEDELKTTVEANATFEIQWTYDVKACYATVTNIESDGNIYTVYGKVNIIDNYDDDWVATFSGEYEYDESSNSFDKIWLDVAEPRRN